MIIFSPLFVHVCTWGNVKAIVALPCAMVFALYLHSTSGTHYMKHDHDDVIKWKHFPCYWPFVRGIHRSPVNSPRKSQWRGALMFSLIYALINGWVNIGEAGDLRRHHGHYDVSVMTNGYIRWLREVVRVQQTAKWPIWARCVLLGS